LNCNMRGILAFAEYSWIGDKRNKEEIKAAFRQREYGYPLRLQTVLLY